MIADDGLPADNVRYFTVEVRPPWKVLVSAPRSQLRSARTLAEQLAPAGSVRTGQARFECEVAALEDLVNKPLDDYMAACLPDPPPLTEAQWQALDAVVERGGGVGIWLGKNAQPSGRTVDDFNTAAALKIMPGKLARIWRHQDAFLAPQDYQHPVLAKFRSLSSGIA